MRGKLKVTRLETVSFLTGMVVLAFELSASRIVAPYIGATIYSWTSIIGGILAGLAVGYYLGGYLADKRLRTDDVAGLLSIAALTIFIVNLYKDPFLSVLSRLDIGLQWLSLLATIGLFVLPTIVMGAVTPYLARLSLNGLKTSGRQIARINAAGTIGSLFGTFITGYVLFGFIGTRNILNFLAAVLFLGSFLVSRRFLALRLVAIALIAADMHYPPAANVTGLLKDVDSTNGRIQIIDRDIGGKPARVYRTEALGYESGVYLYSDDLAFDYIRSLSYAARLAPTDGRYLIIGGGSYTLPSYIARNQPDAGVDVVEIDGMMTQIARDYFRFRGSPNLKIYNTDGRQFLNRNNNRYDYIAVDAFNSIVPPFQLTTKEAVSHIKASLNPAGLVAVNVVSSVKGPKSKFAQAEYQTYRQQFGYVGIFQVRPGYDPYRLQNLMLIASRLPIDAGKIRLVENSSAEAAALFQGRLVFRDKGIVLSDEYAPVERLISSGI